MRVVIGLLLVMLCVAALLLLGEWLHRIFRVTKGPPRPTSPSLLELFLESGEHRYSIRHLERHFLLMISLFLTLLLLLTREKATVIEAYLEFNSLGFPIAIILAVSVWWAFRKGIMR